MNTYNISTDVVIIQFGNFPELDVNNNIHYYYPQKDAATNSTDEINISNASFINEIWDTRPLSEIIIKTSVFLPVTLWGIFGNLILLYVLVTNRHLRTPTNLLIGNMAAADLASLLIHPWVFLIYDFFQNYILGRMGCKIEGALECAILLSSVISLSAITYDRFTAIVLPKETRLNRRGAKIVMAVTWVAGIVLASPLFFYRTYKEREWLDFVEKYCTEDTIIINIYWHVIITMLVWLPLITMLGCYISIFVKLRRYEKIVRQSAHKFHVNYKKRAARMMFIVVLTFIFCRVPFTALIFYRNALLKDRAIGKSNQVQNQVNGTYKMLWWISKYLIFLNSAMNPVIYGFSNEKLRRAFKTTKLSKWLYPEGDVNSAVKKKTTKETDLGSNKNRIFTIFKTKRKNTVVFEN